MPCAAVGHGGKLLAHALASSVGKRDKRLGSRQHTAAFDCLGAALGVDIEKAHGVNVVAPEFDAHGLLVHGREEIQNAATACVLSRTLDLLASFVAAANERTLYLIGRILAAVNYLKCSAAQSLDRQGALQKRRDGRNGYLTFATAQSIKRRYALLLDLTGSRQRGIKGKVTGIQHSGLFARHGLKITGEAVGRRLIRTHDKKRHLKPLIKRRCEVCPMHRRKPRNERRKSTALEQIGEGGGFLVQKYLPV